MKCNSTLKLLLLFLLYTHLVMKTVDAYSFISPDNTKKINEIADSKSLNQVDTPKVEVSTKPTSKTPKSVVLSSNVIMVWGTGHHVIDNKSFEKLQYQAKNMTHEESELLIEGIKNMSTQELSAFLNTPNFEAKLALLNNP